MKKIKDEPKIEKVFDNTPSNGEKSSDAENKENNLKTEEEVAKSEESFVFEQNMTEEEKKENEQSNSEKENVNQEKLNNVKSKISQILKDTNIEIVDENEGDEYEEISDSDKQSQQDYDTLKAMFGGGGKTKKDEIVLQVDDFDYTYSGKYIDDFDLLHAKTIKHIKLRKKMPKKLKVALIVSGVMIFLIASIIIAMVVSKRDIVYVVSASISQSESTSIYYVGDYFNFDGLKLNIKYSNGETKVIDLNNNYLLDDPRGRIELINGKWRFLGEDVFMTFLYENKTFDYKINVKNRTLEGISALYADDIFNLVEGDYIVGKGNGKSDLVVVLDYGEYGKVLMSSEDYEDSENEDKNCLSLYIDDEKCIYQNKLGWKLPKDISSDSVIKIVYKKAVDSTIYEYILEK